jgi:adenylate cyclase
MLADPRNPRMQNPRPLPPDALVLRPPPHAGPAEELFEAAVLFTDVRRSSQHVTSTPARDWFRMLQATLRAQAGAIGLQGGQVLKSTGDGLLAVFRGTDRCRRAFLCALALAEQGRAGSPLPFGIGLADGEVLAGLVGGDGSGLPRQQDVVGASVHLAARLCAMAAPGEVVSTHAAHAASGVQPRQVRALGPVAVRGFPAPVPCVAAGPGAGPAQSMSPSR